MPIQHYYGRRVGRHLKPLHDRLLHDLWPQYALPVGEDALNLEALFPPQVTTYALEIGFGTGTHVLAKSLHHPQVGYVGCEPYMSGVTQLLKAIQEVGPQLQEPLANLKLTMDPLQVLLQRLPPKSLSAVYILFPDPWPKARHHKRRVVHPQVLPSIVDKLQVGGTLVAATDHAPYATFMLKALTLTPGLNLVDDTLLTPTHWGQDPRPAHWPVTRFEARAHALGSPCRVFVGQRRE